MHRHIGIYSGTFDPVHAGHIAFANEARRLLQLDKVIFLPERFPRQKQQVTPIEDRQKLLNDAVQNQPGLASLQLPTDQFTVRDTLPKLHRLLPDSRFTFLMGSDVALHLATWKDIALLTADASILVAMREGDSQDTVERAFQKLGTLLNAPIRYTIIDSPHPNLRSSIIKSAAIKQ